MKGNGASGGTMGERGDENPNGMGVPVVLPYPRPAFDLDALWNIVSVDLANYTEAFPAIVVDAHFFDALCAFPHDLPLTARAERHTAECEIVRALTYFEYLVPPQMGGGRADYRALMHTLTARLGRDGKLRRFTALRQEARTGLQQLAARYATLTFAAPVRICTLSIRSPFDRLLILRFHCALEAIPGMSPDPERAGEDARWRVTLLPQNDLTEESLGLIDHWKVDYLRTIVTGYHDMIHALVYMEKENPYRGDHPAPDARSAEDVVRTPEPRDARRAPTRSEEEEVLARELAARGIPFETIPEMVYPGMHYITPLALVESGVTQYSQRHILLLIRQKEIAAITLGGKIVLDAFAVRQLLDREAESAREHIHAGGRHPGPRRARTGRREDPA